MSRPAHADNLTRRVVEALGQAIVTGGWDAAGASWYGFTTFWINRSGQPLEALDVAPTATGRTMDDVVAYLIGGRG